MVDPCAHYPVAIGALMQTIERIQLLPQPHSPAVTQILKNAQAAIQQLEAEYFTCRKQHPLPPPHKT